MDYLWSPWRYQYVSQSSPGAGCIFCLKASENQDERNFIVHRGAFNFIILNLYPYATGHSMVVPYEHVATLEAAPEPAIIEMMQLARQTETHLRAIYQPHGFNFGINIGQSAGAGIPGHIHMHVLPRWTGDTNFMTTVAETRVLPETLDVTYEKLKKAFGQ
jgi:ATP adenylyltransferase